MKITSLLGKVKRKPGQNKLRVGLDVGQLAVRALVISPDKDKPSISSFVSIPLKKANSSDSIKKAISSLDTANCRFNVGLSGSGVIIRYITLPQMTKEELRGAIQFEAEKHIPFPVKDVNLDAYILDENLTGNQMLVLLAAVKKEVIEQCLKLMQSVGIEIEICDINTIALINAFLYSQRWQNKKEASESELVALLDIGAKSSSLDIISGSTPRLSRAISVGSVTMDSSNKDTQFLNLSNEIRRSFDFYESQSEGTLKAIFLSGEGARYEGIEEFLVQNLSLPVKFWDPSLNCNIAATADKELLKSESHNLAVALGLALRLK